MKKIIFRSLLVLMIFIVIAVILVTQPVFTLSKTQAIVVKSNAELLKNHVRILSDVIPRGTGTSDLNKARDYIYQQLSLSATPELQKYTRVDGDFYNIIVKLPGKNDCPTYVFGAHYDAYDGLPGADDNASGVAGLIELSRLFNLNRPLCPVELVAYSNEEPPYFRTETMGSYVHAKSLFDADIKVAMMMSLEMIGYYSEEENSQGYPVDAMKWLWGDKGNFISLVGDFGQIGLVRDLKSYMKEVMKVPVSSINAPASVQGVDFSDHLNYWKFDYPGVMLTDTAFNRNRMYHTIGDTYERLNYEKMADVITGVFYASQQMMASRFDD